MCALRLFDRFARNRFIEQRACVAIYETVVELVHLGTPVQWRDYYAGKLAAPMQRRRLPAVLQDGNDMIARVQAERIECCSHRGNLTVPFGIRQPHIAIHNS